jgi:hypothetical protein
MLENAARNVGVHAKFLSNRSYSMRAVSRVLGVIAISALVAGSAEAQGCFGFSSLQTHKMNIGANAWFADGATSFGGQFHTALSSLYLGVGAGITTFDVDGSDNNTDFNAELGLEKASGKIMWCPQAEFGMSKSGAEGAEWGKTIGGRFGLGYEAGGSSMKFIPFGNIGLSKFLDSGCDDAPAGFDCDDTDVDFGAGLGIRFNNGMQISPQFQKSTTDGAKAVFGVTVSFPFGSK